MMQVDSGGSGKKGERKKMDTRVDFTPMVDMIMLLLTFFMLATTLSKPQTMEIALPSKEIGDEKNQTLAKASEAVTLYLGADNKVYYFMGEPDLQAPNFLKSTTFGADGLRAVILEKNRKAVAQVNELKDKKIRLQVTQQQYDEELSKIKVQEGTPTVIIKPLDNSNYDNLVTALDEMLITSVGKYAITEVDENDKKMLTNSGVEFAEVKK